MKYQKVYLVKTGLAEKKEDILDWSSYKVIAEDVANACTKAKKHFKMQNEYIASVTIITVFDK